MFIEQKDFNEIKQVLPINAVELLIVDADENILLFKRTNEPAKDEWWLPGGRIRFTETRLDAAKRLLKEECGVENIDMKKLGMFEYMVNNDTENYQQHVISTIYIVKLIETENIIIDSQTSEYAWKNATEWNRQLKNNFLTSLLTEYKTLSFSATSFYMNEINSTDKNKFIRTELYNIILQAMSVPCVDILVTNKANEVLLIKRKNAPAKDEWWIVGGRILFGEKRIDTAKRKVIEECGLEANAIKELTDFEFVFNTPGQQIIHNVSTIYETQVDSNQVQLDNQSSEYKWKSAEDWLKEPLDDFIKNLLINKIQKS
jgi:colanic acid biosynthesis protein WcaH